MARKSMNGRVAALERQIAEIRVRAVEAGEFRLVDKAGRTRAVLGMTRSGPCLAMMHEDGTVAMEVALAQGGPSVRLTDEDGRTRVFIGATRDAARIGLADGKGAQRVYCGVSRRGKPALTVYDSRQIKVWEAPV